MKHTAERVLLYCIRDGERLGQITDLLKDLSFSYQIIDPSMSDASLGSILLRRGFPSPDVNGQPIPCEMMILSGLSNLRLNELLKSFRQRQIPSVALKAVVTETNIHWTLRELSNHLLLEHMTMTRKQ